MADEQRDPREAVLDEYTVFPGAAPKLLARLDAADPLRAMLPEVVEALRRLLDECTAYSIRDSPAMADAREALTKHRALTATEGGTDDEGE